MRILSICTLIALILLPEVADARGRRAPPSQREQKKALDEFRTFYGSEIASVRALGINKLKDMDFPWRVEELIKVIRTEQRNTKRGKEEETALVIQEAIDILGTTRDVESIKSLMHKMVEEKDSQLRIDLIESLGGLSFDEDEEELPWEEVDGIFDGFLESGRNDQVMAALDGYGALRRSDKFDLITPHLKAKDWQVRSAAVQAIFNVFDKQDPKGILELIEQLDLEQGKLRTQIRETLELLTGWDCLYDKDCWNAKYRNWQASGGKFGAGEEAEPDPNSTDATIFGAINSDRLLFVIDMSSSMLERFDGDGESVVIDLKRFKDNPRDFAADGELSKWDVVCEELMSAIDSLEEKQSFNIIFFASSPMKWKKDLQPASKANKKKAIKKILATKPSKKSQTDIYGALEQAFQMAGSGVKRESGAVAIDTVYFLTDGIPTTGQISVNTLALDKDGKPMDHPTQPGEKIKIATDVCYDRIVKTVKRVNKFKKLTVHTVGVGRDHAGTLLERLAKICGGQYRTVEGVMVRRAKRRKKGQDVE